MIEIIAEALYKSASFLRIVVKRYNSTKLNSFRLIFRLSEITAWMPPYLLCIFKTKQDFLVLSCV